MAVGGSLIIVRDLIKYIGRSKTGRLGAGLCFMVCLAAILAPVVAPNANDLHVSRRLQPPSCTHLFGTDELGRDVFGRVLHGSWRSIITGLVVSSFSAVAGTFIGTTSAFFPLFGSIAMRFVDALMAFPTIILALALMAIAGHASFANVLMVLTIVYTPRIARLVYGLALRIQEFDYVESARAIGCAHSRVLLHHIVPNLISPIIVQSTLVSAFAILEAAALDFLGVGVPPYIPTWGAMLGKGRLYLTIAPWLTVFPGLGILAFVLGLNLLGDALRDALDPRLKKLI